MSRRLATVTALAALLLGACAGPKQAAAPAPVTAAAPVAAPDRTKVPEAGPAPELRVPAQKKFKLSNGLAVRLVEYKRLPIVALNLVVDAELGRGPRLGRLRAVGSRDRRGRRGRGGSGGLLRPGAGAEEEGGEGGDGGEAAAHRDSP